MFMLSALEKVSFRKRRVTVFLSDENVNLIDELARTCWASRSKIINQFLSEKLVEDRKKLFTSEKNSINNMMEFLKVNF